MEFIILSEKFTAKQYVLLLLIKIFIQEKCLRLIALPITLQDKNFNVLDIKIFPFLSFVKITPFLAGIGYAKLIGYANELKLICFVFEYSNLMHKFVEIMVESNKSIILYNFFDIELRFLLFSPSFAIFQSLQIYFGYDFKSIPYN